MKVAVFFIALLCFSAAVAAESSSSEIVSSDAIESAGGSSEDMAMPAPQPTPECGIDYFYDMNDTICAGISINEINVTAMNECADMCCYNDQCAAFSLSNSTCMLYTACVAVEEEGAVSGMKM